MFYKKSILNVKSELLLNQVNFQSIRRCMLKRCYFIQAAAARKNALTPHIIASSASTAIMM